jgi:hypothetical protein
MLQIMDINRMQHFVEETLILLSPMHCCMFLYIMNIFKSHFYVLAQYMFLLIVVQDGRLSTSYASQL